MSYASILNGYAVPQTEALNERQVQNNAGGFVFSLDKWGRLERFLILGSDAPTYYQKAQKLTRENAKCVAECWSEDADRTAARIVEISISGRAPRNSPAIFAVAIGATNEDVAVRKTALSCVAAVCRTATHLFEFGALLDALGRGWGRAVSRAFSDWYEQKSVNKLAYQMTKYRSREGYTHGRVIQRVHPKAADGDDRRVALYRWACGGRLDGFTLPDQLQGHLDAMNTETPAELLPLIEKHGLTWEQVPTWALKNAKVWEAMLPNLGMTALLRNLSTLTDVGVLKPLGEHLNFVTDKLRDPDTVAASRLHPYAILNAMATYRSGKSEKGERRWAPIGNVIDALDDAFYLAFGNVVPTGKSHLIALDVSGSMGTNFIGGSLSAREAAAAMSMVTARTEKNHFFTGFTRTLTPLDVRAGMSLSEVQSVIQKRDFGTTDCSAPMTYALEKGLKVDAFVVYTDNETYAGRIHPVKALERYRRETGINAKLIVAGMTSTGFTIADPKDPGMLDVVGFDANAPAIMADFVRP